MASTTVKPYPHVQINVKDNSIASVNMVETLPVHRPLYVMRTQKGPIGRPVWCNTYSEAAAIFGARTFDPADKTYFSKQALYLRETFTNNGAFISRYLSGYSKTTAASMTARITLYAKVTAVEAAAGIQQYKYDDYGKRIQKYDATAEDSLYWVDEPDGTTKEAGIKIQFLAKAVEEPSSTITGGLIPLATFSADNPGAYGLDLGLNLFYDKSANDPGDVKYYKTLFYNLGFVNRDDSNSTWFAVKDIYNRDSSAFAANPDTVNPDTGASMNYAAVLDKGFSDSLHQLPMSVEVYEKNFNILGLIIAAYENDVADADGNITTWGSLNGRYASGNEDTATEIGALTTSEKTTVKTWVTTAPSDSAVAALSDPGLGYKVNVIGLKNLLDMPYDHVEVDTSALAGYDNISFLPSYNIALAGVTADSFTEGDATTAASDDTAMYNFVKLRAAGVEDEIVESLHYPFTHIFDVGYSMKTKKAMLDFLDVRDDVMVILSTQALMRDGSPRAVTQNDQAADEGNGEALRAYALLMRESVLYGTDCMRCSIYCHSGHLADSTYTGVVPFTYWDAVQYSKYGNLTYMKQDEPRGLPNSYNLLFKDWNWWNYRADSQSRVWDNGMNYVQYADMTRLFYPALRTVYRASTSVLVDEWFVAAVVYAKYICRHAWATFSGRNDTASILQGSIKKYLDTELGHLFNGKYAFDVSVYQTAEEQELGYIQHVKLSITSGATMRVLDVDIEVNREGFTPEE